jgi:hypothetical protein
VTAHPDHGAAQSALDHAVHTPYSDPGEFAALVMDLPVEPETLSVVARNVIVHYRASGHELPAATRSDVNARWLDAILDLDQRRHPMPLSEPRDVTARVQGCCRDHTLFCVGALRSHGVPARSRVGFAGYFIDGWHHDHVVVEAWIDGRWRRFDSEVDAPRPGLATPTDIGSCDLESRGFVTAAQVWAAFRRDGYDVSTYGVGPEVPGFRGERFVFDEVIYEVAHRFGDELLLWDGWGRIGEPDQPVSDTDATWLDGVAELLLAADGGDARAEQALLDRYRIDSGLHPGQTILQASPYGDPPIVVELATRSSPA